MKRYYTVKEAAELLGFSTNTVYTYLETGKLKARRIGKGRFKIPFDELAPYINSNPDVTPQVETIAHQIASELSKPIGEVRPPLEQYSHNTPLASQNKSVSKKEWTVVIVLFLLASYFMVNLSYVFSGICFSLASVVLSHIYRRGNYSASLKATKRNVAGSLIAILVGIFLVNNLGNRSINTQIKTLQETLSSIVWDVNRDFDLVRASLASSKELNIISASLKADNSDDLDAAVRSVFDSVPRARKVFITTKDGLVRSTYPTDAGQVGKSISGQDFYEVTKNTLRNYISALTKHADGSASVTYAAPLFVENEFVGLVAVDVSLENISKNAVERGIGVQIYGFDRNDVVTISANQAEIGNPAPEWLTKERSAPYVFEDGSLLVFDFAAAPSWKVVMKKEVSRSINEVSGISLIIALVLSLILPVIWMINPAYDK